MLTAPDTFTLRTRDRITVARMPLAEAQAVVVERHYLRRPVHPRADPFAYAVSVDGQAAGVILMATPHYTRKRGLFGYPGLPTQWQTLMVARLWLDPTVQGRTIVDHAGRTHTLPVASCALAQVLRRVQRDWLEHHPPRDVDQPYQIRLVLAYADLAAGHDGTIYQAANFRHAGLTQPVSARRSTRGAHTGSQKALYVYELSESRAPAPIYQLRLPFLAREVSTQWGNGR